MELKHLDQLTSMTEIAADDTVVGIFNSDINIVKVSDIAEKVGDILIAERKVATPDSLVQASVNLDKFKQYIPLYAPEDGTALDITALEDGSYIVLSDEIEIAPFTCQSLGSEFEWDLPLAKGNTVTKSSTYLGIDYSDGEVYTFKRINAAENIWSGGELLTIDEIIDSTDKFYEPIIPSVNAAVSKNTENGIYRLNRSVRIPVSKKAGTTYPFEQGFLIKTSNNILILSDNVLLFTYDSENGWYNEPVDFSAPPGKQDKPEQIIFSDEAEITLRDNAEYLSDNEISLLRLVFPEGRFQCYLRFVTSSDTDPNIIFPDTAKFGEKVPEFGQGEEWEVDIKDGIVRCRKVISIETNDTNSEAVLV